MPREKDSFRDYAEFLQNNKWKCNFCNKEYGGSVTRIKAHLAGVGGYGIHGCNVVDREVRSEARKALKDKGPAESSNRLEGNVLGSSYPPLITFIPLHETNVPSQSLPARNMIPQRDFSFWTQPPQSQAGDSNIQPQNLSYPSSGGDLAPEALTNMPHPANAGEGEPNTEVPQGISLSKLTIC
ncbi:hypothetical protein NL676_024243 [Syzygium grande]|nr:hypothetical protein NL676_024243 [Syzygium grande]